MASALSSTASLPSSSLKSNIAPSKLGSSFHGSASFDKVTPLKAARASRSFEVVMTATLPPRTPESDVTKKAIAANHRPKPNPVTHTITSERLEAVQSLSTWAEESLLPLLKPIEKSWQPSDYLPTPESEGFIDQVIDLRKRTEGIPDELLVCLVGDMITEEALPTYQTMLNTLDGVKDESGADNTPFAIWTRAWTAEENRHGDLLNKYLYLTGRVNMRSVEKTIQYLIGSGMDPKTENNPYLGYVYTSFQERATFVSHGNTARHAKQYGDEKLAVVCGLIAADEKRHEVAYQRIVERLFELDPTGTMLAFEDMMRKQITMPAHLMFDGESPTLFDDFSAVAQRTGVYTAGDYADIMAYLVKKWNIEKIEGLTDEGRRAQEYVARLPPRIKKLTERAAAKAKKTPTARQKFSWVFNREVELL